MFQQHPVSICFYLLFALSLLFLAPRDNDNIILLTFMCGSAISMCIYGVEIVGIRSRGKKGFGAKKGGCGESLKK